MKPFRPLMAAVAAAGLLAAGCDYWSNLAGEKKVTKVTLTVTVLDAWTKTPLAAECKDPVTGIVKTTDGAGRITLQQQSTGSHTLSCEREHYFPASKTVVVGAGGANAVIEMASMGKEHWYPGDPDKQVRFSAEYGGLRFPDAFSFHAIPMGHTGGFRYEWTFLRNSRLNQTYLHPKAALNGLTLRVDTGMVTAGEDSLIVSIQANLAGREWYEVGSDTISIQWVRNILPRFTNLTPSRGAPLKYRVGCANNTDRLSLNFAATDLDGTCDSVVFHTSDSLSAFGKVHYNRPCNDPKPAVFTLKDPRGPDFDDVERTNTLQIFVYDDNGQIEDSSYQLISKSNALPVVKIARADSQVTFLTKDTVRIRFDIRDTVGGPGGRLEELIVDWGDGEVETHIPQEASSTWETTVTHVYQTAGIKYITGSAVDFCRDTTPAQDQLNVKINVRPPR